MSAPPVTPEPPKPPKPRRRLRRVLLVAGLVVFLALIVLPLVTFRAAREAARQAIAATELAQLQNALGAFKAKMNATHLPAGFRLRAAYDPADPELAYLRQLFPQIDPADTGLPPGSDDQLDPSQAFAFFLTGGRHTNYAGFSTDKAHPFRPSDGRDNRIGPFLDPDHLRLDADGRLLDPWGTPYAYLAVDPTAGGYPDRDCFGVRPYRRDGQFVNKKGYQLISAGPDRRFGPGGNWTPGEGLWADDGPGADDLSNFNTGPLGVHNN